MTEAMGSISLEQWHRDEQKWWNRFADIMAAQWELDARQNQIIRDRLVRHYTSALFVEGGRLLDIGCGNGWITLHFAGLGMETLGLDFSGEQIAAANAARDARQLRQARFECCDVVNLDEQQYAAAFDSIMLNSFLHHLHPIELERLLGHVARMLKPGGTAFLYEPLVPGESTSATTVAALFPFRALMALTTTRPQRTLRLTTAEYEAAVAEGYGGLSPHETPVPLPRLRACLGQDLAITSVTPWHLFSLPYALRTAILTPRARRFYAHGTRFWHMVDAALFSTLGWQRLARQPFLWCMCSVVMRKAP